MELGAHVDNILTAVGATNIAKLREIVTATLEFLYASNLLELSKGETAQLRLFNADILHEPKYTNKLRDALQYKQVWDLAALITDETEFGPLHFIFVDIKKPERLGLLFNHGKLLSAFGARYRNRILICSISLRNDPQFSKQAVRSRD